MSIALAIDIGASSGRHILGEYVNGEIQMTEVYRFSNGFVDQDGVHCWDIDHLNSSILEGLKKKDGYCPCKFGKLPENKCMCEEFKAQIKDPNFEGLCHCGLYYKEL